MNNSRLYFLWGSLTEALRTGQPQNESKTGGDFFAQIYADPERLRCFVRAMSSLTIGPARVPYWLALRAEALHLAAHTPEALETIQQAETLAESSDEGWWRAELQRLRGVFVASLGAEEAQVEAAFREAIATAQQQKSISLEKRAEATYAEYRRQKASRSDGRKLRLPL